MKACNGLSAERLAVCYHECGHAAVGFALGASVTKLILRDGLNGWCERSVPEGWTWRNEVIVIAAGAAAKIKHRKASQTISLGLDGADGDVGKSVFLKRLVNAVLQDKRRQRLLRTQSEQVLALVRKHTNSVFALSGDQRPRQLWDAEAKRSPRLTKFVSELHAFVLNSPADWEWQGWNKDVAAATTIVDFDWVWSAVQQLATELNSEGEIHSHRANDLLQAQRERANGSCETLLPSPCAP